VNAGAASVFFDLTGIWTRQTDLTGSDTASGDFFGDAVAVGGDTVVIGARGNNHAAGENAGAAYVFDLDCTIPGDLNDDGCVDQSDLGILLADWNCTGGDCPGDCDGDGDTDQADLGILLAYWGEGCP
jgi:hypothetical protein